MMTAALVIAVIIIPRAQAPAPPVPGKKGIDVSSHQVSINWQLVAGDGVAFTYIKATEGTNYVNPFFLSDWTSARQNGVRTGAYHFFSLCTPGAAQAENFLRVVPRDSSSLPPAVDLELSTDCLARPRAATFKNQLDTFIHRVERATHKGVVYYVGSDLPAAYAAAVPRHARLWLYNSPGPPASHRWVIWQKSATAHINGIAGNVDLDEERLLFK